MSERAILFLQLGGPETLEDVRGFLYRLFADPEVIRIRFSPLRKLVAGAISATRAGTSRKMYAQIGGGSPIRRLTDAQAAGVERLLRDSGREAAVRTAMTCSRPLVEEVVAELHAGGARRWMAFPLYPQYSLTTTKGALDRARRAVARYGESPEAEICSFPDHPKFLAAHADLIRQELAKFPDRDPSATMIVFSAHSIPRALVTRENDPYERQVRQTVDGIVALLPGGTRHTLAYQSKLGPVEWLGPATADVLPELGRQGERQVLVVPVAFVTDHIETLYEIDLLLAPAAREAGVAHLRRTPGLNAHPLFLECLADLAREQKGFWA